MDRSRCVRPPSRLAAAICHGLLLLMVGMTAAACGSSGHRTGDEQAAQRRPQVVIVLTNHAQLGDTGTPTGFYLSEAAHPWKVFTDAQWDVTLASPLGGPAPIDPKSLKDIDDSGRVFLEQYAEGERVPVTADLAGLDPVKFDAVFFAGGHGTMWDFPNSPAVRSFAVGVYNRDGIIAAVCHGPAALVNLMNVDGEPLVKDQWVTGFTNAEEEAVGLTNVVPFLLETRLQELGARFVPVRNFERNVVTSDRLVTGQNPASAHGTAEAVVAVYKRLHVDAATAK